MGALPLGLLIAFGSMNRWRPLREAVRGLVWVVRGTPLMLQLIVIYYGPGLLANGAHLWGGGGTGRMAAAATAFIINYACYFSEIYRGGIESIPRGQREAGQVLGMTRSQIFFRVQLLHPRDGRLVSWKPNAEGLAGRAEATQVCSGSQCPGHPAPGGGWGCGSPRVGTWGGG